MMKLIICTLALGLAAAQAPGTNSDAAVVLEKDDDPTVWGLLHLNTNGELEISASKCVDSTNLCGGARSARAACTHVSGATMTDAGAIFRNPGSTEEAAIELWSDGVVKFSVSGGGCVNVTADCDPTANAAECINDDMDGLILDNMGTKGAIVFETPTTGAPPVLNFHTAGVHSSLQPTCWCAAGTGTAATSTCTTYQEHHCEVCAAGYTHDTTTGKTCVPIECGAVTDANAVYKAGKSATTPCFAACLITDDNCWECDGSTHHLVGSTCTAHTSFAALGCHANGQPTKAGNATTDNTCGTACDGITEYLDAASNQCENARSCDDPGVVERSALSSTANRVCQCAAGYGSLSAAGDTCTACTPDVDFAPAPGSTSCTPVRAILYGMQLKIPGNATTDRITECQAGYVGDAAENPTSCTECTAGTDFAPNAGTVAPCDDQLTVCVSSYGVEQDSAPTITSDRTCKCKAGWANATTNPTTCAACDGDNEYTSSAGSTACSTCSDGHFGVTVANAGAGAAGAHTACDDDLCQTPTSLPTNAQIVSSSCSNTGKMANVDGANAADTCAIECAPYYEAVGTLTAYTCEASDTLTAAYALPDGVTQGTCQDIDECLTANGGCDTNADCSNNVGAAATCTCKPGWYGSGTTCTACAVAGAATYSSGCTVSACNAGWTPNSGNTTCESCAQGCFDRCTTAFGVGFDQGGTYMCYKGCAGVSGGAVQDGQKFCNIAEADRYATCKAGCDTASGSAANQAICRYGCEFWQTVSPWTLGSTQTQTCNQVCGETGRTCNSFKQTKVNDQLDEDQIRAVFLEAGINCSSLQDARDYAGSPFYKPNTGCVPFKSGTAQASRCDATMENWDHRALCHCDTVSPWTLGSTQTQTCNQVCAETERTCNSAKQTEINDQLDEDQIRAVFLEAGINCSSLQDARDYAGSPFYKPNTGCVPFKSGTAQVSRCDATKEYWDHRALCYCE